MFSVNMLELKRGILYSQRRIYMKKLISVFLSAVLLSLTLAVFATAGEIYPESYSENSETYYGSGIESAVPAQLSDIQKITYHTGLDYPESYERTTSSGKTLRVDSNPYNSWVIREGYAFAGWAETPDGAVAYRGGEEIESGVSLELYAVWCPTYLEKDEVFRFTNSEYYFKVDEKGTYYMTQENIDMLRENIFKTFGPSPVPGFVLGAVLATYPSWDWRGSCYGISTVTALQHYGRIDVKSLQNAENLVDMDNDSELISYINYYQANAATSWLCENKAATPGTAGYAASMKDMFESVKNGRIVLYTFYTGNAFVTPGHTVLLTGAYEDVQGNHIFVTYDCNRAYNYTSGRKSDRFTLSPDFKYMTDNDGDTVGAANWTDTYSQFDSFNIDGSGKAVSWYSAFFAQIGDAFKRLFSMI